MDFSSAIKAGLTVREACLLGSRLLAGREGIDSPPAEARLILCHILGWEETCLWTRDDTRLSLEQAGRFADWLERRAAGYPLAYLTGEKEFYGLKLIVSPAVLIPRPETELAVDICLEWARKCGLSAGRFLDLCTGSGAVALALAHSLERASVWASDISPGALEIAAGNARRLGLDNRVRFLEGDLLEPFLTGKSRADKSSDCAPFNCVVSNPPYVARKAAPGRPLPERGVSQFEPGLALYGGEDGLDIIRRMVSGLPRVLASGGLFVCEIGCDQGEQVTCLLRDAGFGQVKIHLDWAGLDRAVSGILAGID